MINKLNRTYKLVLLFFIASIVSFSLISLFEEPFDTDQWKSNWTERHKMVDDLIESRLLIGKRKNEVLQLLGNPKNTSKGNKDFFTYRLGNPPSFFNSEPEYLMVVFVNGKVDKVTLAID